jgi:hypothetical protein
MQELRFDFFSGGSVSTEAPDCYSADTDLIANLD